MVLDVFQRAHGLGRATRSRRPPDQGRRARPLLGPHKVEASREEFRRRLNEASFDALALITFIRNNKNTLMAQLARF